MPPGPRRLRVDLHGHDVRTALRLATTRVEEAYRNGYDTIELVHGAANVQEPVEDGRGRIKWELRHLVTAGAFDPFCDPGGTWMKSGSVLLRLRRNPRARRDTWSREPPPAHRR